MFEIVLVLSTSLSTLVAGFVFAFASVVMPGIQTLNDRDFLRAFQVMDRVIQRKQPVFMLVWVGSAVGVVISLLLSFWYVAGLDQLLLVLACTTYLLGVQLPTATINIPLNNWVQRLDLDSLSESDLREERTRFEGPWTKWNAIRTILAALASMVLITLVLRL